MLRVGAVPHEDGGMRGDGEGCKFAKILAGLVWVVGEGIANRVEVFTVLLSFGK